ncbi:MAG: hypothetical protein CM1200mP30_14880 [Pseudomonadota bacterium]|nr:MAG: hypothetical protein CM1200mP30_14880 [Pseudomonadota bacterium]
MITLAQGETSCGVELKCLPEVARLAKENGVLVVVDAVCTLTTMPMQMDEWGIDIAIAGGQKGLSSIPGVSLIAFSEEAWKTVKSRKARSLTGVWMPCAHRRSGDHSSTITRLLCRGYWLCMKR